jgi:iron-sulfur cluster repair protein YtfE (RIC family)
MTLRRIQPSSTAWPSTAFDKLAADLRGHVLTEDDLLFPMFAPCDRSARPTRSAG